MASSFPPLRTAPALRTAIFILLGVAAASWLPASSNAVRACLAGAVLLVLGGLLVALRRSPSSGQASILTALLCFCLGMLKLDTDRTRMPVVPDCPPATQMTLIGSIEDDPSIVGAHLRLLVKTQQLVTAGKGMPFRTHLVLTVFRARNEPALPRLRYGMTIAVRGRVERPPQERNPGEFDTRAYYEANGTTHIMTVKGGKNVVVVDSGGGSWYMTSCVLPARRWIVAMCETATGNEEGELLKGLLIGERGGLSQRTKDAFVNAGVAHVLAVSGSNVAVVAAIIFLMLEFFRIPSRVRMVITIAGLLLFMDVTGAQPPVVRATIMATVLLVGRLLQMPSNGFNAIGVSAIVMMAIDARQLFDVGFQLSYGAVLSIMVIYPVMSGWIASIPGNGRIGRFCTSVLRVCAVSLSATLGTLPITAVAFGRVSIIGVLANIIVIPATEFSVMIGAATIVAGLCWGVLTGSFGAVNYWLLHCTIALTRLAGFSQVAYIDTVRFTPLDALPYFAALIAVFFLLPKAPARGIALLLVAANVVLWIPRDRGMPRVQDRLRVSVIDVGQGDAVLIECPGGPTMLYDTGPLTAVFDAGEKTVVPFLLRRNVTSLDAVALSHPHSDHAGGLASVLRRIPTGRVLAMSPEALRKGVAQVSPSFILPPVDSVRAGDVVFATRNFRAYVVYPVEGGAGSPDPENESLVLKIEFGAVSFLLTGDAERGEETSMVSRFGNFLHCTVLRAGHHGSKTSSSQEFLDAVRPEAVVISVGRNNRFGHPSPVVLERFEAMHVPVYRTDEEGAIVLETDGKTLTIVDWR